MLSELFYRIYKYYLQMKSEEPAISWKHFEKLYEIDHGMPLCICPRITKHHLELQNSSKIRVRLAVQVNNMIVLYNYN